MAAALALTISGAHLPVAAQQAKPPQAAQSPAKAEKPDPAIIAPVEAPSRQLTPTAAAKQDQAPQSPGNFSTNLPIFSQPGVVGAATPGQTPVFSGAKTATPTASEPAEPLIKDWRHSKAPADAAFGAYQMGMFLTAFREATRRVEANSKDTAAMTLLAELYRDGLGIRKSPETAVRWYKLAAGQGDRQAAFALARAYFEGTGVEKSEAEARKYIAQAAAAGHGAALYNLGIVAMEGEIKDYRKAASYFRKAIDAGDIDGAYSLAFLYREGLGVEKSDQEMAKLLKFAADRHHIAAEVEFAITLFNGAGVAKDEKAAAQYFIRAAWRNAAVAQNRLARMYAAGRGVTQDDVEAMKWHIIARGNGLKDDWLEDRLPKLTKTQRAVVDEAVKKFASK